MISNRTIGVIAMVTPVWFCLLYYAMSSMRPEYQHATKAISELGSVDAPNGWLWNLGGYILSGLGVSMLGVGLRRHFRGTPGTNWVSFPLIASGIFMAISGVFPGDFENRSSATMILHTLGALGSFLVFLVCGFAAPFLLRRHVSWRAYAWPSLAIVLLSIASGFLRSGAAPGIGQRLGFAFFFLWIGLMGFGLFHNTRVTADTP